MKAKILLGELADIEFELSDETVENIKENIKKEQQENNVPTLSRLVKDRRLVIKLTPTIMRTLTHILGYEKTPSYVTLTEDGDSGYEFYPSSTILDVEKLYENKTESLFGD